MMLFSQAGRMVNLVLSELLKVVVMHGFFKRGKDGRLISEGARRKAGSRVKFNAEWISLHFGY